MDQPRLRQFHGRTFQSTDLQELYAGMEAELNDVDAGRYADAGRTSLPFTGFFANTMTSESIVSVEGGFRELKQQFIDVFGMINRTPVVVRIEGWKPNFLVLIPIGVNPAEFKAAILQSARSRSSRRNPIACVTVEIITMPEFGEFQFGCDRRYLRVTCDTSFNAKTVSAAAVDAFHQYWANVDSVTNGYDIDAGGCSAVTDPRGVELHRREKFHYPLRFTGSLSEQEMVYHFMTQEDIALIGHLNINKYELFDPKREGIRYSHGIRVQYAPGVLTRREPGSLEENFMRNALCCSYDIETMLSRAQGHKFSDPRIPDDSIMTIGMAFYRVSQSIPELSIALLPKDHPSDPLQDATVIMCKDEEDMIRVFSQLFLRYHTAVLTGYNIDEFDNRYMYLRAQLYGLENEFVDAFSEYDTDGKATFKDNEKFKLDNGYKENLHRPVSTQRATVDARLRLAKMRPKEFQEAESLNVMLKWYKVKDPETQGDVRKMDMPIGKMYQLWEANQPEGIHDVAKYCVIDARVTYLLLYWINFFTEMFELSNTSYTTLLDSFHRADGKRVTQLLTRYARAGRIAFCNELPATEYRPVPVAGKIGGGDVKSLWPGLQHFVISLDYKSEYPAQKEGYNIGSSAKVPPALIADPGLFGMVIVHQDEVVDQYCSADARWRTRRRYWIISKKDLGRFEECLRSERASSDSPVIVGRSDAGLGKASSDTMPVEDGKDGRPVEDVVGKDGRPVDAGLGKASSDTMPVEDGKDGRPVEDGKDGRPVDAGLGKASSDTMPVEDGKDGRPVEDGKDGRPVDAGLGKASSDTMPVEDGKDGRPVEDGKDGRPVDAGLGKASSDTMPVEDGKDGRPVEDVVGKDGRPVDAGLGKASSDTMPVDAGLGKASSDTMPVEDVVGKASSDTMPVEDGRPVDADLARVIHTGTALGWIYRVEQFRAEANNAGKTLEWKTYFTQSPRDDAGNITHHHSIQAQMLTDLRAERDKMKARMAACYKQIGSFKAVAAEEARMQADISKLEADAVTFNARQNSVKVLMNSEYGTGNNARYPHFDQDVAATVTWCSRRLAEFLRRMLTCDRVMVPDYIVTPRFLDLLNEGHLKDGGLAKFGFSLEEYIGEPPVDEWKHPDGTPMINLNLITEKRPVKKWYCLYGPASRLVYQDTDSNYYRVPRIEEHYSTCSDPIARAHGVMHALLDHNDFYALLVGGLVNRWPIAVSCDGAFLSAYWSPMKKQYMGVKCPITHDGIAKIGESLLFPKLSDRGEDEAVSKFLDRKSIKVTGYLIIRRETPTYVINLLFTLLENLLCLRENADALVIARDIMKQCECMIKKASRADAKVFSKQQKYKPSTQNEVRNIVNRLRQTGLDDLVPPEFSVARYVLTADAKTSSIEYYARGKTPSGRKTDRMRLLGELAEGFLLDVPYYLDKMAKALSNLIFEELIVEEMARNSSTDSTSAARLESILREYHDSHIEDTKESKAMAKKAMKESVVILMSRHYTVPGAAKAHSQQFKKAETMLSNMTVTTGTSQRAVKQTLSVAFDRSTPAGALAETVITTEVRLALLRRTAISNRAYDYANFIRRCPTEKMRRDYISNRTERIHRALTANHREMVKAYAALITAVQKIDPILSRMILQHRNAGTDVTFASLASAIPVDYREKLAIELIALDGRVEPFRESIRDKRALEKGLEMLGNGPANK